MFHGSTFPSEIVKVESTELICALVASGHGLTILPRLSVTRCRSAPTLRPVRLAGPEIPVHWHLHAGDGAPGSGAIATRLAAALS